MPDCDDEVLEQRQDVIHDLRSLPVGLDEVLEKTIPTGVGFHRKRISPCFHPTAQVTEIDAGLTAEEREILAMAYDSRIINVIVATCSLAAGINLPARRVILHGARMGRDPLGPAMLSVERDHVGMNWRLLRYCRRQMRGRAGRKGKDEVGESFLCCQKEDLEEVVQLLEADLPKVQSSMTPEKRGIKR